VILSFIDGIRPGKGAYHPPSGWREEVGRKGKENETVRAANKNLNKGKLEVQIAKCKQRPRHGIDQGLPHDGKKPAGRAKKQPMRRRSRKEGGLHPSQDTPRNEPKHIKKKIVTAE